jgi:hypothetical protein
VCETRNTTQIALHVYKEKQFINKKDFYIIAANYLYAQIKNKVAHRATNKTQKSKKEVILLNTQIYPFLYRRHENKEVVELDSSTSL